jgi:hypothetical protein
MDEPVGYRMTEWLGLKYWRDTVGKEITLFWSNKHEPIEDEL